MNKLISMRENYIEYGVEDYYKNKSEEYINPHESQVRDLLLRNFDKFNFNSVLDLCCGGGEVTKVLLEKGVKNIEGADPYTFELYIKKNKKFCINLSFKDILNGKMIGNYNTIICSFAFHLINKKDLFMIIHELFRHTKTIIIISPTKKPDIKNIDDIKLNFLDYSLTPRGKKVYLKVYELDNSQSLCTENHRKK